MEDDDPAPARVDAASLDPQFSRPYVEASGRREEPVAAEWDFEGAGSYPSIARIDVPAPSVSLSAAFRLLRPGTHFPVLRAASQRQGDMRTPYGRILTIGRVRVVVS